MANDYTLGRGKVFFARHETPGQIPTGNAAEKYFGNTPEFNITVEEEKLDHFSSDAGIREKDDSISLEVTRTASLITDNIDPENLALFFFGTAETLTVVGGAVTNEAFTAVQQGYYYQLGVGPTTPSGVRDVSALTVNDDESTPGVYTSPQDYTIDLETGRFYIVPGGDIVDGTNLVIDYTVGAHTRDRVVSGGTAINGAMRYVAANPKGTNRDVYMPYVTISPNGDFALKGDEWAQIPFTVEILKLTDYAAIYIDGRPV